MDADTELVRQFREAIGQWPSAVKLAFLRGEIDLEEAMRRAERDPIMARIRRKSR